MGRLMFFIVLFLMAASWAAENPAPGDTGNGDNDQEQEQQTAGQSDQADAEDSEEEESPGRFIPSEEISQDLGVSFPVDI